MIITFCEKNILIYSVKHALIELQPLPFWLTVCVLLISFISYFLLSCAFLWCNPAVGFGRLLIT